MKIEIFIFNYGKFDAALELYQTFNELNYKTFLLNCESPADPPFTATDTIIKLPNIFYSGQWNESLKLATGDVLFFINSDVTIPNPRAVMYRLKQFYQHFKNRAGIYAPNHYWTPWTYNPYLLETVDFDFKKVPSTDSTLWAVSSDIAKKVGKIDTKLNLYGWGIEIIAAFYCFKQGKLVVRDYHVKCDHPQGTAYNRQDADHQWRQWVARKGLGTEFWNYYHTRDKYGFGWEGQYKPKKNDIIKVL